MSVCQGANVALDGQPIRKGSFVDDATGAVFHLSYYRVDHGREKFWPIGNLGRMWTDLKILWPPNRSHEEVFLEA